MYRKFSFLLIIVLAIGVSCTNSQNSDTSKPQTTKNIILLIGDGMGVTQVYSAITRAEKPLNFERFPYSGFSKTYSVSDYITDSGAGGTAIATGHKTKNKAIAVDISGNKLETILELAEKHGLSTGLVATCFLTHATPASFFAHDTLRYNYEVIAEDFLDVGVDAFVAGGKDHFADRKDGRNLIDSLESRGYYVTDSLDQVLEYNGSKLAGFVAPGHPVKMQEGRGDMLKKSTEKVINILSKNEKGFFMMVEGSQIDWGGHDNDAEYVIEETLDFDKAIGAALDFAEKDGNTLVVVTADHETGGMAIVGGDLKSGEMDVKFTTGGHSSVMVPVFAYGPGAENFSGIMENTSFFNKFKNLYGFSDEENNVK